MTFGRPPSIPDNFVKLELPSSAFMLPHPGPESGRDSIYEISVQFYGATM
jgi:hypothetical protein